METELPSDKTLANLARLFALQTMVHGMSAANDDCIFKRRPCKYTEAHFNAIAIKMQELAEEIEKDTVEPNGA